ncbi:MAG: hypothetical protein P8Y45_01545 [Exilibacterium sp.]
MQISNYIIFGVAEAYILLSAICVFLLMHTRNLKKMVLRLQEKTQQLIQDLRQTKAAHALTQSQLKSVASSYKKHINDQLLLTRQYHQKLGAGQDIALDLNTEAPLARQVAAFRHAVLIAEKEAIHASDNEAPKWGILEQKFSQLIQFYKTTDANDDDAPPPSEDQTALESQIETLQQALENSKKRVENLEKFKKLFFDMEKQWKQAREQAGGYHEQLSALASQVDNKETYESLLTQYYRAYDDVGKILNSGTGTGEDTIVIEQAPARTKTSSIEITQVDKRAANELKQLRKVAEDQHNIINELQQKLAGTKTLEEKDEVLEELNEQLKRQTQFVKEAETCIQLLENELSNAVNKVNELETELENVYSDLQHMPKMQTMIQQFTVESKEMLEGLATLERENEELIAQIENDHSGNPQVLDQMKRELSTLQGQYAELEERYLELRMQN